MAPIYESLAKKLSVNPNIIIAKCDATANEVININILDRRCPNWIFPNIEILEEWIKGLSDGI